MSERASRTMPSLPEAQTAPAGRDAALARPPLSSATPERRDDPGRGPALGQIERPTPARDALAGGALRLPRRSTSRTCSRATSARRSTSTPTTCSSSCTSRSSTARVGRLNAGELDIFVGPDFLVTIPNQPLQPVEYLFERCRSEGGAARAALLEGLRLPALPDRRRQLRLLLPDAAQDRQQARRARGGDLRGALRGGRPRHLQREAGDHQLPQGDPPAADRAPRPRERQAALPRPETSTSRSTSTTSSTPTSGSGTCSRTTRRWSRRSRRRTSRCISHRVNEILRVLTSISVIVLPLTLIASIWGMNVGVPGEGDPEDFYVDRRRDGRDPGRRCSPTSAAAAGSRNARRRRARARVRARSRRGSSSASTIARSAPGPHSTSAILLRRRWRSRESVPRPAPTGRVPSPPTRRSAAAQRRRADCPRRRRRGRRRPSRSSMAGSPSSARLPEGIADPLRPRRCQPRCDRCGRRSRPRRARSRTSGQQIDKPVEVRCRRGRRRCPRRCRSCARKRSSAFAAASIVSSPRAVLEEVDAPAPPSTRSLPSPPSR